MVVVIISQFSVTLLIPNSIIHNIVQRISSTLHTATLSGIVDHASITHVASCVSIAHCQALENQVNDLSANEWKGTKLTFDAPMLAHSHVA